ncbi:hypothetical protein ACH5RR_031910 [Cinchona calisaya]|uniref:Uncharacterized protein n=1 Tax=Cinchona calisaya TaxID=153742 RepID=A0ABD2YHN8_9GENT
MMQERRLPKISHKETEATPTQNSKDNLTKKKALNATIGDSSCHNTLDKEESSENTSGRDRPWNRPKKGNKGNNAQDLDMAIINSEALIRDVPNSTIPLEQLTQYVVISFNTFCPHAHFFS